ncbi:hypothetical protein BMS3Bbin03_02095 [bacterium BMS3Bbin03]|nr:hypothetical protein BMS3Bbin03_02095 [bacterium BMS3Bbin03]
MGRTRQRFYFGILAVMLAALAGTGLGKSRDAGRLLRYPDITRGKIVFTYEDDLWLVPETGGTASRLTDFPGVERFAKFSPDGKWIAFTGSYDGGNDVYVMPSDGGVPVRLTYHPAADAVLGWTPDSRFVLFRSRRTMKPGLYKVALSGGYPVRLPVDRVRYASLSPDGRQIAFNRFDSDRMNWKGYKGGAQQDVWVGNLQTENFRRITHWPGYDIFPMWVKNAVYFASDRKDGRMNLYRYSPAAQKFDRLTYFKNWDVEFPSYGNGKIVYGCKGYLWTFNLSTRENQKLDIRIPSDRWRVRNSFVDPADYVQDVTLSAKGDTAVVQARGDIYLLSTQKSRAVNLTNTSGSREIFPSLSPDGKRLAFFSDKSGDYELYITRTEPNQPWRQITAHSKTYYYHLKWSPDGKKILFGDKRFITYYADIDTRNVTEVDRCLYQKDNEIYWEISDYDWSPDSKWITYSKTNQNLNSSIYIYNLKSKQRIRLTGDRYDDFSPAFDRAGKYLYFLSNRHFEPQLDPFMDNNVNVHMTQLMVVQLQSGEKPPFEEDAEENSKTEKIDVNRIDLKGLSDRIYTAPVAAGTYKSLQAAKGKIFFLSRKNFGFPGIEEFFYPKTVTFYTLKRFNFKTKRTKSVISGIGSYAISSDGGRASYLSGKTAGVISTDDESFVGEGLLDWNGLKQSVHFSEEYHQIYWEAWRQIRDFFYDPHLHGKNWKAIGQKYAALIPYVGTRADLNYLLGQMIGELTASHEYIVGRGGPKRESYERISVGLLGADLVPDFKAGAYRFAHILKGSHWKSGTQNPLLAPNVQVKEGDYLLAIDGKRISPKENVFKYLQDKAGTDIQITVNSTPDMKTARTYRIRTLYSDYRIRYYEWVEKNYRYVKTKTKGRVGYIHLSDMDRKGLEQFEQGFRAERYRDGLIIDVRNNGGGFVNWFIIDKLERKLMFLTQTRDFHPMYYPHGVHPGPMVVLCNSGTGSDGEVFSENFKDQKLGLVIGTRTWGGLIGIINMIPLVDGGMITQSNVGFANLQGQWVVENHGVDPDIYIEKTPKDFLTGRDPQLDKAIDVLLKELKTNPPPKLTAPPFPKN